MSAETMSAAPIEGLSPSLLDLPIRQKDGSSTSVIELLTIFDTSHYVAWMSAEQKLRFHAGYGYGREAMLSDLGPDVSPTGHHGATLDHALAIIEREREEGTLMGEIDNEDLAIGLFAIGIHDLGECEHPELLLEPGVTRLIGDIPAGGKTPDDRAAEAAVRHALYRKLYSHVDPDVIERIEAIIAHRDETAVHDLFEGSHQATTLQTTIHAEAALKRYDHMTDAIDPKITTALEGLAIKVRAYHREIIMHSGHYSHLKDMLLATEQPITRHFTTPENAAYHQH